jgi:hypothetical protein
LLSAYTGPQRILLALAAGVLCISVAMLSYLIIFRQLVVLGWVSDWEVWFMMPGVLLLWPLYPGGYHSGTGWFAGVVISNVVAYLCMLIAVLYVIGRVAAKRATH